MSAIYQNVLHKDPLSHKRKNQKIDTLTDNYYTAEEAAHILGVKKKTLTHWCRTGKGPECLKVWRQVTYPTIFYSVIEIDKFLKKRKCQSTSKCNKKSATQSQKPQH